jgi:16S rRNA (adenine(1408)-N(1))-methyltransferase
LIAEHEAVVADLGTGGGAAVLRRARANPGTLVIGIDADTRAMADSSRRAADKSARGGLSNAIFLTASADELPGPLDGRVDELAVALPWGSLLRGLLDANHELVGRLATTVKDAGMIELLMSATERDVDATLTLGNDLDAECLAQRLERAGLGCVDWCPASVSDVKRLSSGWGRRLGIPERRQAWLFRARSGQAWSR